MTRAGGVLHEVQLVEQLLVADDQRPAQQVAVPAEVFGGRVHDDVGAQLQRPREHRRGERAVDAQQRAARDGRSRRTAAMSVIDIRGLPGLSIHTSFVAGVIAASSVAEVGRVGQRDA